MPKVNVTSDTVTHRGEPVPVGAVIETSQANCDALVKSGKATTSKGKGRAATASKPIPLEEAIKQAMAMGEDARTADGVPRVDVLEEITGRDITEGERDEAVAGLLADGTIQAVTDATRD